MSTTDEARAEAERRYPKRSFVVESHVQNSFVAGAEWQASRKVEAPTELTQVMEAHAYDGGSGGLMNGQFEEMCADIADAVQAAGYRKVEAAPSDTDRETAIASIEYSRDTHIKWRDWLRVNPDDPAAEIAGDVTAHEQFIARYDNVLAVLRTSQPVQVEVTTVEELEALPVGSVVQSADYPARNDFALYRKHALNLWLFTEGAASPTVKLPATVLYRPAAALGGGE